MYLSRIGNCFGGWGKANTDAIAAAPIDYANLRECTVLWAVSIPGQSLWCTSSPDTAVPENSTTHVPPYPHKFPIPGASHLGIYNNDRSVDSFKSTELYTFVGILTSEPLHVDLELDAPRIVPTLHVLFPLPLPPTIVPRVYPDPLHSDQTREELIEWIARVSLADDRDAAEWVLLSAISRVQSRTPPILPLNLTISRFPSSKTEGSSKEPSLIHALSKFVALLTILPLSLETLNATSFTPESKNEDLHSGWLQLPKGSLSLMTEGGVEEGTVSERAGLTNLHAFQEMMNTQTIEYVFPFSRFSFDTDVAVVVLVEGAKSAFFQTDINVPLQPRTADFDFYTTSEGIEVPPHDKLEAFRRLVGAAKVGNVTVSDETANFIQEDFVSERQAAPSSKEAPSSHELIQRMMVARSGQD
ncbi:hypothetical protein H0H92_005444 [Tricholoma furcatifolium]|nr:hypothetical protein H0H92_005444 [Tricholoma furcatifolium]